MKGRKEKDCIGKPAQTEEPLRLPCGQRTSMPRSPRGPSRCTKKKITVMITLSVGEAEGPRPAQPEKEEQRVATGRRGGGPIPACSARKAPPVHDPAEKKRPVLRRQTRAKQVRSSVEGEHVFGTVLPRSQKGEKGLLHEATQKRATRSRALRPEGDLLSPDFSAGPPSGRKRDSA